MSGWKCGDVAKVRNAYGEWHRSWVEHKFPGQGDLVFAHTRGGFNTVDRTADEDIRRLVVIDSEDRPEVERLRDLLVAAVHSHIGLAEPTNGDLGNALQEALREFAAPTPPKPEEPTGLGAVVEDASGELWVRDKTTTTICHWKRARGQMGGKRLRWSAVDAVTVLSEGVTP